LLEQTVDPYDGVYGFLVNDTNKSFWGFQNSVIEPVVNRHLRKTSPDRFVPNDCESLLHSDEFRNMVYMKAANMSFSIDDQQEAPGSTQAVLEAIEAELARRQVR
jgi:hypothetical protein